MSNPFFTREQDIIVLGELFVEMIADGSIEDAKEFKQGVGGTETYTAVTASRLGSKVQYISNIARDPFHANIRKVLEEEKINCDHLVSTTGYNGMYYLNNSDNESREYLFHRPGTAVSKISSDIIDDKLIGDCKIVFSSSEFQSVSKNCRQTLFNAFYSAHTHNTTVAYDPNLRLNRWSLDDAREAVWSILPFVDVMLPSAPGESKALFGYERPIDIIGFLWDRDVNIVAVKNGENGCLIGYNGKIEEFTIPEPPKPVKYLPLIGAVFNGAFLSSMAAGNDPFVAGEFAVNMAAEKGMSGNGIENIPRWK
jgi:2-dehydro-3-deoxygluconokinase